MAALELGPRRFPPTPVTTFTKRLLYCMRFFALFRVVRHVCGKRAGGAHTRRVGEGAGGVQKVEQVIPSLALG